MTNTTGPDDGDDVIYVAYITTRSGKRLFAREVGLRGFPIRRGRKRRKPRQQ
jgi:hypothetical protein